MPEGLQVAYANDTTAFIKLSVEEVVKTLLEAVVLVVIVMFVFLQSWRATLVPAIAVPVVLLGTFAIFYLFGFTINTLTLFGLVLAIGLLVDDAIVVVENVERLMEENPGMSPEEATELSMKEIQVALVAIAVVLSAVFLPMAFFGGSTGVIYQQFSITIISCMVLSVLVALILSPAITATLLKARKPAEEEADRADGRALVPALGAQVPGLVQPQLQPRDRALHRRGDDRHQPQVAVPRHLRRHLRDPGDPVHPASDQLPPDRGPGRGEHPVPPARGRDPAAHAGSAAADRDLSQQLREAKNLAVVFTVAGGGGGGGATGQNTGQGFINLAPWDEREGKENSANAIVERASGAFRGFRDAQVFALVPGAIRGLGQSNGFNMQLQNSGGLSREQFQAARERLLAAANSDPVLSSVRLSDLPDVANLDIDVDQQRLTAYGVSQADVNNTLSTAWGGRYVNDFIDNGRVKRVYVQGDAPYRSQPSDLGQWFVRGSDGQMTPFSAFAQTGWSTGPSSLSRFNGVPSFEFQGQPAEGVSSGEAMNRMMELAAEVPGTTVAWSGASFQERLSSGQAPLLYGLSLLVVFLCLAALYESWTIPVAVLLVIPLGLVGAVFAVTLRGLENDVYLQIGLLTTMGLAAKNAILMIEFAEQSERSGKSVMDSAIEAARIRLRPILMTSFAFIFGVLPLALSTGAGANSRIAIGTAVIGGMLTATILAIFYIPLFFVLVRRAATEGVTKVRERLRRRPPAAEATT